MNNELKNIYFIIPSVNGGGAERVIINYINQFKDNKLFKINLVLFDKSNSQMDLVPDFVNIVDLNTKSTKKSFFTLLKSLNLNKDDFVFTTHSRVAFLVYLLKFFKKFIHIARMQNTPSLEKKYKKQSFFKILLYKIAFRSANVVVAQTEEMKNDAIINFNLNRSKVEVLNNPLNKIFIDELCKNAENPFSKEEVSIVMSGRLHKNKSYEVLLNALPYVISNFPKIRLYILGYDEGEKDKLINLAKRLNIYEYITFCGYTKNPYIYYKNADLFVLSSKIEGFPNTLIENYYLNTPVVSTKCIPIIEKLIIDGKNGYAVDVGDIKDMGEKICLSLKKLKRENIKNNPYHGSHLPSFLEEYKK